MTAEKYEYQLTQQDYIHYLRYVSANTASSKKMRNYLIASAPILLAFTCFYFRARLRWGHILIVVIFAVYWVLRAAPFIWKTFIQKRISDNIVAANKVQSFDKVSLSISSKGLIVNNQTVEYSTITKVIPLEDIIIIFYGTRQAVIVPQRLFETAGEQQQFLTAIDRHILQHEEAQKEEA